MAHFGDCPRGGMPGLLVTTDEMRALARELGQRFIDVIIPVPNRAEPCQEHPADFDDLTYWEDENGGHGWCCSTCGEVIQWG